MKIRILVQVLGVVEQFGLGGLSGALTQSPAQSRVKSAWSKPHFAALQGWRSHSLARPLLQCLTTLVNRLFPLPK